MEFIKDFSIPIIAVLLIVVLVLLWKVYIQKSRNGKRKSKNHKASSGTVSKDKYEALYSQCKDYKEKYEKKKKDLAKADCEKTQAVSALEKEIDKLQKDIRNLEKEKDELICKNKKLKNQIEELTKNNTSSPVVEENNSVPVSSKDESQEKASEKRIDADNKDVELNKKNEDCVLEQETTVSKETVSPVETPKEVIMYASFPRSAGNTVYFSDLIENQSDDSYFKLIISNVTHKATFKPLDFMKIRNYDAAMYAILTDGVKPNVASSVIGMEPGTAHIEGNDWIIDNLAKIKLA